MSNSVDEIHVLCKYFYVAPNCLEKYIRQLPPGLTFGEVSSRLGVPYAVARRAIHKFKYQVIDGRKFSQKAIRKIDPSLVDWGDANITIARKLLCSRERVRVIRKKLNLPKVESRGRRKKNQNTQQ
jgi:hypothetical protein